MERFDNMTAQDLLDAYAQSLKKRWGDELDGLQPSTEETEAEKAVYSEIVDRMNRGVLKSMDDEQELGDQELMEEAREWWNDEEKAREAASQFGMTPEEMAEAGLHPDGTPYDSGPVSEDHSEEEEDFARAVDGLAGDGIWQGR